MAIYPLFIRESITDGVYEVSFSNGDFKTYHLNGTEKIEVEDKLGMLFAMIGKGEWHGGQFLNFPPFVGKKWNFQYQASYLGQASPIRLWSVEVIVIGVEVVITPAGVFKAFEIQNSQVGPARVTAVYYYSPETKSIVKLSFAGKTGSGSGGKADVELIKFGSAAPGVAKGN